MKGIYRILDANFNRAREALRVIEDFARFALDDAGLSGQAKSLRSRLQQAYEQFPAQALLAARDTAGDVGTALSSPTESRRADARAVVAAACKRLTEALRTLEEYAKVVAAPASAMLEQMRYQAYTLERDLEVRWAIRRFDRVRLYVLLTGRMCRRPVLEVAQAAIDGGCECIQMREKDLPDAQRLDLAAHLRELTRSAGVLLVVNDRPDLAALCAADGVHLGQDDLPIDAARRVLPAGVFVGRSTHTLGQARAAEAEGADYIAVGPMFSTATKDAGPLAGCEGLRQALAVIHRPHVAIGGITADNVGQVVAAGARCVAVCSAVIAAADPAAAARAIRRQLPE